jgi:hypothetical protein
MNGACPKCAVDWPVALAYRKERPSLIDPTWAANKCQEVVGHLVEVTPDLSAARMPGSQAVWLIGHRPGTASRCPPMRPDQTEAERRVVMTKGGCLIDHTRRQYEPSASVPTHYASVDDAGPSLVLGDIRGER